MEEGWVKLCGARKRHYFRKHRALCGKWLVLGHPDYEEDEGEGRYNCRTCTRARLAETAPAGEAQ